MADAAACTECGNQQATRSYGAGWLCRACWANELARIYQRRTDLLPQQGQGYGPPERLTCWTCGATWAGEPLEWCWWCNQRIAAQQRHQQELDSDRLRDYLERIVDGDKDCEPAAAQLVAVGLQRGTFTDTDAQRLAKAIAGK